MNNINLNDALFTRASALDSADPIKQFRNQFHIPTTSDNHEEIYFCGNSLGLQPKQTQAYVLEELEKWQYEGVKGHFSGKFPWMPYHEFLAPGLSQLVGAKEEEVVAMNSLTTNLHLLMVSFFRPNKKRCKIVIEKNAFPSDFYAVTSQLLFHGLNPQEDLILIEPQAGKNIILIDDWQAVFEQFKDEIALVLIPGVQYQTGQLFDIKSITKLAHKNGAVVGSDLAHAVGNVPLFLHDWDVDFACWCHYKYLNSGPGAVAGCFVHKKHHSDKTLPRFAGWWGHDKETRFKMENKFVPIQSAEAWQLSNPPILSLAAIRASLDVFKLAGWMQPLREKSLSLTNFLEHCLRTILGERISILTPSDPMQRGCQLSIQVNALDGKEKQVFQRLMDSGITVDWREPNIIRVAPVPLYNQYIEAVRFTYNLKEILENV